MSRQPKLRPKTHIPGYSGDWYDSTAATKMTEFEYSQGVTGDRRENRVFRVKRKHVLKACDRCRVKKTKCDGKQPCNRCSTYNHPCLFRERNATQTKVYSRGFVEMLESHHSLVVKALQRLYKHCANKEGFPGEPLAEGPDGYPLIHEILDRLGLIKQAEETSDDAEEESEDLQYLKLLSTSAEGSATTDPSPEPVTPPEPSMNYSPVDPPIGRSVSNSSNDNNQSFKWDMPMFPAYNDFLNAGYHNGMMVSQSTLASANANVPSDVPIPPCTVPESGTAASCQRDASVSYMYYTSEDSSTTQPPQLPLVTRLDPKQHQHQHQDQQAAGLPIDGIFNQYHLAQQDQQQTVYPPFIRDWFYTPE